MAFMILLARPPASVGELNQALESVGARGAQFFQDPLTAMEALCMAMAQEEGSASASDSEGASAHDGSAAANGLPDELPACDGTDGAVAALAGLTADKAEAALDRDALDIVAHTQVGDTLAAVSEVVQAISTIKHFGQELLLQQVRRLAGVEGTPLIDPWAPHVVETGPTSHGPGTATLH